MIRLVVILCLLATPAWANDLVAALEWQFGTVADTRDGVIIGWRHPTLPQPTPAEITQLLIDFAAVKDDVLADQELAGGFERDRVKRLLFEINFDQENRLRALEGSPSITKAQYRAALLSRLQALP